MENWLPNSSPLQKPVGLLGYLKPVSLDVVEKNRKVAVDLFGNIPRTKDGVKTVFFI